MSTPVASRMLISMDTESARVTRKEAAELAGVSERTINRWGALGVLGVRRPRSGSHNPATYDRAKVLAVAARSRRTVTLELPEPDTSD